MITILMLAGGVISVILGAALNYAAMIDGYFAGLSYAAYIVAVVFALLAVFNFVIFLICLSRSRGVKRHKLKTPKHRRHK